MLVRELYFKCVVNLYYNYSINKSISYQCIDINVYVYLMNLKCMLSNLLVMYTCMNQWWIG